jgi:hypothetical protein
MSPGAAWPRGTTRRPDPTPLLPFFSRYATASLLDT